MGYSLLLEKVLVSPVSVAGLRLLKLSSFGILSSILQLPSNIQHHAALKSVPLEHWLQGNPPK